MQRTLAALLVVAGLALGGWTLADRTGDDIGDVGIDEAGASAPTADEPTPVAPPSPSPSPSPSPTATPSPVARTSGSIADVMAARPAAPTAISLPSIGVEAAVVPVGVDPDGLMTVPEDVSTVGWYRFGPAPSATEGSAVLAGHVDDRVQGRGAFFDLRAVEVGDVVTVTHDDGEESSWVVTGRRTFDKASLPVDDLYRRDGPRRLVLITCGGDFDRGARSYESNVVVVAEPAP